MLFQGIGNEKRMKFSEAWLREWVAPAADTAALEHQLTMAGLEVEGHTPVAADFSGVVVAKIRSVTPHPDAKKLNVCEVDAGTDTLLQIVCGAPNAAAGMRAPLAMVGACLPGLEVGAAELRGVASFGMLCSARELGLSDEHEGLLALPENAPVGTDLREYLQLRDLTIELSITPNRGDCLSLLGVAREVGTLYGLPVKAPDIAPVAARIDDTLSVELLDSTACPSYAGRILRGLNARAPTPLWMKERLRRSGLRSISAIVDVTNYVLLELGQPMHAFDLSKLDGGIRVRNAEGGETLELLDGQTIELDAETLVIADHKRSQALAGVMGGAVSAVDDDTRDIFLESAFFTPLPLAGCARRYGLQTDSSYRFERGVDFTRQVRAIERATALLSDICGGTPGPVTHATVSEHLPQLPLITLRASRIKRMLGTTPPVEEVLRILHGLGCAAEAPAESAGGLFWEVTPPPFRFDLREEIDLVEELARIYGYDRLPTHVPRGTLAMRVETSADPRTTLVERGYQEAVTYSFVEPALQKEIDPAARPVALANPISSDMAVMRTTLWVGLLQALSYNRKRQQSQVRLFEHGLRFVPGTDGLEQEAVLAGLAWGTAYAEQWGESKRGVDFYDARADVEALLASTGRPYHFAPGRHPALHPGQCAEVFLDGSEVGLLGTLHPSIRNSLDLPGEVYLFELRWASLSRRSVPLFQSVSRFPSMRRDLALVLDEQTSAQTVEQCVHSQATELLNDFRIFDVYRGAGIEAGKKSLALGLTFRAVSRNLTETEIDEIIARILKTLEQDLHASLRD